MKAIKITAIVITMIFVVVVSTTPAYAEPREQMLQEIYDGVTNSETGSYRTKEKYAIDDFSWTRALETKFHSARGEISIVGNQEEGYEVSVNLPGASMEDVRKKDSTYEAEVDRLVALVEGKTVEEKIRFFHDYLTQKCSYDYSYSRSRAYDCLITGSSVCNGYALAFYNLCDSAGLDVKYIVGKANTSKDGIVLHAWNAVKLDEEWKYFDLTWNDCLGMEKYYGLSEEDFAKDHFSEQVIVN